MTWRDRVHEGDAVNVAAVRDVHTEHGWILAGETGTAWSAYSSRGDDWVNITLPGGYEVSTPADMWSEDIDVIGG